MTVTENATTKKGTGRTAADNVSRAKPSHRPSETVKEILARRAAQLAEAPVEEDGGEHVSLLLARLGRSLRTGGAVRGQDRAGRVPDPCTAHTRLGGRMTNLRGRTYSVVDLRRYFGLLLTGAAEQRAGNGGLPGESATKERADSHLIIVRSADMDVALLVDDVLAMERVPESRAQEATGIVRGLPGEYVRGVTGRQKDGTAVKEDDTSMVVMLDLPALLANGQLVIHEEIA